jgi:hypothetical protein
VIVHTHGGVYVRVEISSRDISNWRAKQYWVVEEAQKTALVHGLRHGLTKYIISGPNDAPMMDMGYVEDLQKRYPDVTANSIY